MPLSIVIICCNNSTGLRRSLKSVEALGDEILIYDTGKTNDIKDLAEQYHARLINAQWEGYGKTRWKAAQLAAYNWILMLDTDEIPDEVLKQSILTIDFSGIKKVYKLK
ncbi:MAG: glycosyltransferase [Sphingobacteriales bacterium]